MTSPVTGPRKKKKTARRGGGRGWGDAVGDKNVLTWPRPLGLIG